MKYAALKAVHRTLATKVLSETNSSVFVLLYMVTIIEYHTAPWYRRIQITL